MHHFQPIPAFSPAAPAPAPALCPWSVALTVRVLQHYQHAQGCHVTGLVPTAQLGAQKHDCLLRPNSCCGEQTAFCISRSCPSDEGQGESCLAQWGIVQSPFITLQHDAAGQHLPLSQARFFGHIRELWEQGPLKRKSKHIERG